MDLATKGGHIECTAALKTAQATQEAARLETFNGLLKACIEGSTELMLKLFKELKEDLQLVINMTVEGSNTLLFKYFFFSPSLNKRHNMTLLFIRAAEVGHKEIVQLLLNHGADARVHPVTKYSPLYIACYNGHKDIAELLLKVRRKDFVPISNLYHLHFVLFCPKKFPELVQTTTVEKWLPSHGCCIQGHYQVLDILLKHQYPSIIMKKYTDKTGVYEYELPFDINAKDVSGTVISMQHVLN